jgi:hypothetical protein
VLYSARRLGGGYVCYSGRGALPYEKLKPDPCTQGPKLERADPESPKTGAPHSLASALESALERTQLELQGLYRLEPAPSIVHFVRVDSACERESVLVSQEPDVLTLRVLLPLGSALALSSGEAESDLDAYLEALEGVSHFLLLAERARIGLPTTLLELELQAEVDKFALLALHTPSSERSLSVLHRRVYDQVSFLHAVGTEQGDRYRLANGAAARFWARVMNSGEIWQTSGLLPRFYRASPSEKLRLAAA